MTSIFEKIHENGLNDIPNLFDTEVAGTYIDLLCYEELEELEEVIELKDLAVLIKSTKPIKPKYINRLVRANKREQKACR
jgi:hypothetical protein